MNKEHVKLSFENSKRLLARNIEIDETIDNIISEGFRESKRQANSELNKKIYDLAEEKGVSLWDICLAYVPRYNAIPPKIDSTTNMNELKVEYEVTLEPLILEFEQGPGYWKGKYYELKRKMQELIDSKK